jgi:molybdopterin-guanine dinucleotide biosynthesis protein A
MILVMKRGGFVLVGGKSSRMGRDKALLPFQGSTLLEHIALHVAAAAGSVTLIGEPDKYRRLGFPVLTDNLTGAGPLSGIQTALSASRAEWNLIVACDMPELSSEFLTSLLEFAEASDADCLIPIGPTGRPEPLCAAYRLRCLPCIDRALARNIRKVTDALAGLDVKPWNVPESVWFQNVNTPAEWTPYSHV